MENPSLSMLMIDDSDCSTSRDSFKCMWEHEFCHVSM